MDTPKDNGNCNMFGAPGANLFTEATVGAAQQRHWPALIDTLPTSPENTE